MPPLVYLIIIAGAPVLLGILLRVNSLYLYTSVIVGELLVRVVGDDASLAISGFIRGQYSQMMASLFLLLLPLVVTILLLRKTLPRTQILIQLPALIATGASLYIFTVPLLTGGVIGAILLSPIGKSVNSAQDVIIAASGIVAVSTMWVTNRHHNHKHGKHHK
ncbi:hypothetical protein KDA00_04390 [Candidatus Saccharibacteria bacterium]|nr:hypothetical protein [Candidatus Saccharibacteria bacterium]